MLFNLEMTLVSKNRSLPYPFYDLPVSEILVLPSITYRIITVLNILLFLWLCVCFP